MTMNGKNYIVAGTWAFKYARDYRAFKEKCLPIMFNNLIELIKSPNSNPKRFETFEEALKAYNKALLVGDEYDYYSIIDDDYTIYGLFLIHETLDGFELMEHFITKTLRTYKGKVIYDYDER